MKTMNEVDGNILYGLLAGIAVGAAVGAFNFGLIRGMLMPPDDRDDGVELHRKDPGDRVLPRPADQAAEGPRVFRQLQESRPGADHVPHRRRDRLRDAPHPEPDEIRKVHPRDRPEHQGGLAFGHQRVDQQAHHLRALRRLRRGDRSASGGLLRRGDPGHGRRVHDELRRRRRPRAAAASRAAIPTFPASSAPRSCSISS